LRDFLARLEAEGELARVGADVDLRHELGAVCSRAGSLDAPALLFERPGGHAMPIVANLFRARRRIALALETDPATLVNDWRTRIKEPIPPVTVAAGGSTPPCQENVLLGDEIDLTRDLPIPIFNELDGGPYITAGCHITVAHDTGTRNVGVYRNQVHGPRRLGILSAPYRHLRQHHAGYEKEGRPLPVAIVIGVDPAVFLGAVASVPAGVDELGVAGALRGKPVELVPCLTVPIDVPATAEIVLECEMPPEEFLDEGPFGELTGYYSGVKPRPVLDVKALSFRNGAIHHASYLGRPPNESSQIEGLLSSANILEQVTLPGLRAVHLTDGSSGFFKVVASIDKPFEGYGKMMAMAILGTWNARAVKEVVIVDSDIDPANADEVEWAIASRVQADRDVEILTGMVGAVLDPSLPDRPGTSEGMTTAKMIVDATRYDAASFPSAVEPPAAVFERVVANWERYGIPAGS
jgi:UbiD family decarboxylase